MINKTYCKFFFTLAFLLLFSGAAYAQTKYEYIPNIIPHTRHNTQMDICFYYYGYGSCNVTASQCSGVPIGDNKWINLGDACNRNSPPTIQYTNLASGREGQRLTLDVYCLDDDPVNLTLTGWMTQQSQVLDYTSAGTHQISALCTDSFGKTASGEITVTVTNTNRAPLFRSIEAE
jgi:hypothetical protein